MRSHRVHVGRRRALTVVGTVALLAGVLAVIVAVRAQQSAPQPPASAASFVPVTTRPPAPGPTPPPSSAHPRPSPTVHGPTLARSVPTHLDIPAIGVHSPLPGLGLAADGTVQVPPLGCHSHAGWYKYSPTPGQEGPAIILGHIDSAACGPGVFFHLGDLRQRDTVSITLADHTVAVFAVERVVEYRKAHFPTLAVYGNTDHAALRLITCGGKFDPSKRSYESNIVAYAALVSSHPA